MQLSLLACVSGQIFRATELYFSLLAQQHASILCLPPTQYINFLACLNDYLSWKGLSPIITDVFGGGLQIMRMLMWLHTTPAMVYLLSIISDFDRGRILRAVLVDIAMISLGITAHLGISVPISGVGGDHRTGHVETILL